MNDQTTMNSSQMEHARTTVKALSRSPYYKATIAGALTTSQPIRKAHITVTRLVQVLVLNGVVLLMLACMDITC